MAVSHYLEPQATFIIIKVFFWHLLSLLEIAPADLCCADSLSQFKRRLKNILN